MLFKNQFYLLLIIPALLGWLAQWRVQSIYYQYLKEPNKSGLNGSEIVGMFLAYYHLNLPIIANKRKLVNYYNPQNKTLHFSKEILESTSITSLGIVAHEIAHIMQDNEGCKFMVLRKNLAKNLAIMGQFSPVLLLWSIIFRHLIFVYTAVVLLFGLAVFAILSLPIEINASKRGLHTLREMNIADENDIKGVSIVLRHAAFTYFAGALQKIGTFLFIMTILFMFR